MCLDWTQVTCNLKVSLTVHPKSKDIPANPKLATSHYDLPRKFTCLPHLYITKGKKSQSFTGCGSFNTNLPTPLWHFLLPPSPELVHAQKDHLPEINLPMPLLLNPVDIKTFKACIDLSCSAFKSVCSCNCEKYNFNQIKTSFKVILVTVLIDTVLVRF